MDTIIWDRKQPVLQIGAVFNGSGVVNIENDPQRTETLPLASVVEFTAAMNVFKLVKGFKVYESLVEGTAIKVEKQHLVGVGDVFPIGAVGADATVASIDYSNDAYDIINVDVDVTITAGTVASEAVTKKISVTNGEAPVANSKAFCGVLAAGIVDSAKLILPAGLGASDLIPTVQNVQNLFV